ncbi:MAG: hypothetical protein FWG97_05290 [Deltaproteobacteria bacterium]|nr:hypothetical protein [Deltaproteobacteria bacterium]
MLNLRYPKTMESSRLIRPQTKIDLALEVDYLTGLADIRSSMILDHTPQEIIIAQTQPPIRRSHIGQNIEASIVHKSAVRASRWGWTTTIQNLDNQYVLNPDEPESSIAQVIFISGPAQEELTRSNIRQAYRLESNQRFGITLNICPNCAPITLLNFSALGLMLSTSKPAAFSLGQELAFELAFPSRTPLPIHCVSGQAEIVRLELSDHYPKMARLGLKFLNLSPEANRAMPKILNYYMLEEQRIRNRDEL